MRGNHFQTSIAMQQDISSPFYICLNSSHINNFPKPLGPNSRLRQPLYKSQLYFTLNHSSSATPRTLPRSSLSLSQQPNRHDSQNTAYHPQTAQSDPAPR